MPLARWSPAIGRLAGRLPGWSQAIEALALGLVGLVLAGCQPQIGSECESSTDCSVSESRDCDTTQPNGYCTRFDCGPGDCPSEAMCVAFHQSISAIPACLAASSSPRLLRTACMLRCDRDDDCRGGYVCVDLRQANPWAAAVVDAERGTRFCGVPAPALRTGEAGYCAAWSPGEAALDPAADAGVP